MPIYEYECQDCHHRFEFLMIGRKENPKCPKCGKGNLVRLPTSFGVKMGTDTGSYTGGSCPTGTCPS